jgi:hypothetical protein
MMEVSRMNALRRRLLSSGAAYFALLSTSLQGQEVQNASLDEEYEAPDPEYDYPMGAVLLTQEALETIPDFLSDDVSLALPDSALLSPLPKVYRQRGGSCSAWACAHAMSILRARKLGLDSLPRRQTFDAKYVYDRMWRTVGGECNYASGFPIKDAMEFFALKGAPLWGTKHSFCDDAGDLGEAPELESEYRMGRKGAVFRFFSSKESQAADFNDVFRLIAAGFPVIATISATDRFRAFKGKSESEVLKHYKVDKSELADDVKNKHAVCVVGFNSLHALVMNSWGEEWGHKGFAWIEKTLLRDILREAWAFEYIG